MCSLVGTDVKLNMSVLRLENPALISTNIASNAFAFIVSIFIIQNTLLGKRWEKLATSQFLKSLEKRRKAIF